MSQLTLYHSTLPEYSERVIAGWLLCWKHECSWSRNIRNLTRTSLTTPDASSRVYATSIGQVIYIESLRLTASSNVIAMKIYYL
ncbi:hypothetical protein SeMB42_g00454 [Synchytrium endobioticum]|uniref:Uncharacterized protein n=1 Tax=Synchytrium endobioticum TaxID=286115 RepID=A0A507DS72_9FUNG|nr:hypothetical protein SeMB42_g00454 [Synchytrium endobioticum]